MTYDRFQGDPAVKITENGATMEFKGGQPIMDQGLENAAQISLFTKRGYWGNTLTQDENEKIGSDFEQIRPVIDIETINDYTDDARVALQWMKTVGLASKIDINVTNPRLDLISTSVLIYPPGVDTLTELLFIKNGLNWLQQAANPAHERFTT